MKHNCPLQFAKQDVLVPWHLQPKYSGQPTSALKSKRAGSAKVAARKAKKAEKQKNKYAEKSDTNLSDSCSAAEVTREEGIEESGWCPLGELQDLFDEDVSDTREEKEHKQQDRGHYMPPSVRGAVEYKHCTEPLKDASSSDGRPSGSNAVTATSSATNNLSDLGYKTFQRYYHVFCHTELTKLFSQVRGVGVLEEFYDHENWCVLVEKQENLILQRTE